MDHRIVAGYEILDILGEGGMGIVYRARDAALDRDIALKVIRPSALGSEARARFLREAKACSRINHPNIVTVYAAGEDGGTPWFAMELLEGETLRSVMSRGPVPWGTAVAWVAGILDALDRLHAEGIVHRDLKPENIVVTREGAAKLMDFGIAHMGGAATLTVDGDTLGTAHYMSPEQAQGKPIDRRSDIFSIGAVLYEMLCGEPAFAGDHPLATMYAIANESPRPIGNLAPDLPAGLQETVMKALEKGPDERHADAAAFRDALRAISKPAAGPKPSPRALLLRGVVLPAALIIVFGVAAVIVMKGRESRRDRELASRHDSLAQMHELAGRIADAEIEYQKAIIADRRWEYPLNNLAMLHIRKGSLHEADSLLRRAIALSPRYAAALYNLGDVRWKLGDLDGAERYFGAAIDIDSSLIASYNNLGALLVLRGKIAEAVRVLDMGLAREAAHPADDRLYGFLLKNRGIAAATLGLDDEAIRHWQSAVELIPDNPELNRLMAECHERSGRPAEAAACWRRLEAVGTEADRAEAARRLERLQQTGP